MDKEILEGNKLIAEFMGMREEAADVWSDTATGKILILGEYRPHIDWNELMEVVDKIEAIHHIKEQSYINVRISQGYIQIEGADNRIFRSTSIEGSKIKALWLAVIDFIKWYINSNQPQQ